MSHPRIEEVEDSDVEMSDPSEGDIDDFADEDIMRARPSTTITKQPAPAPAPASVPAPNPGANRFPIPQQQQQQQQHQQAPNSPASYAGFQTLYPVYFDASRSHAQGRRVSSALAVSNPLAVEIAAACQRLGLAPILEPTKTHPKDWANPGRVRVLLRPSHLDGGNPLPPGAKAIKNKHHLYTLVAQHLKAHPTTESSQSLKWRLPGREGMALAPPDLSKTDGKWPRPAVPRGWKVGELVPYWSPAVTGGGVSENLFKDMMGAMGGAGGPGGAGGLPGGMDMASLLGGMGGGLGLGGAGAGAGAGPSAEGGKKDKKERKGKGKG